MARGKLGSFVGTATAGEDMIPVLAAGRSSSPKATDFAIRKIAISASEGVTFRLNGETIVLTATGMFETAEDQIEIRSLIFEGNSAVNIRFLY